MDRQQQIIAEKIDSGEYYEDAKEWFSHKYISPVTERSFFIVVTLISVLTSLTAFYVFFSFLPLVNKVPIAVDVGDMTESYAFIKPLTKDQDEDPNQALIRYLIFRYVKFRERYVFDDLGRSMNYIQKFSSEEVLRDYKIFTSIRNPESPVLKYRQHTTRSVEPIERSYSFFSPLTESTLRPNTNKAIVNFDAYEVNVLGSKKTMWQAELEFRYSDVEFDRKTGEFLPLNFVVTDYKSKEIR